MSRFERSVSFSMSFDGTVAPVGFTGSLKSLVIPCEAQVEWVVGRITSDTDMGAIKAYVALRESVVDCTGSRAC